jgi:enoyl-CoA hydratase/carnithine racemase
VSQGVHFETFQFEVTDAIGVITLNRPETINALNQTMIAELEKAFDILDQDESIRVLILTGAGEKGFCSGLDMKASAATLFEASPDMNLGVASLEQALQVESRNQAFMLTALKAGLKPPDKK